MPTRNPVEIADRSEWIVQVYEHLRRTLGGEPLQRTEIRKYGDALFTDSDETDAGDIVFYYCVIANNENALTRLEQIWRDTVPIGDISIEWRSIRAEIGATRILSRILIPIACDQVVFDVRIFARYREPGALRGGRRRNAYRIAFDIELEQRHRGVC